MNKPPLEIEAVKSTKHEVVLTLSNGIIVSLNPNSGDRLYLHFSGLGDGNVAVSAMGREDDPQKLDLANYVHIHLPNKDD